MGGPEKETLYPLVFVTESELEVAARETAIAHIARAVRDYFLFVSE